MLTVKTIVAAATVATAISFAAPSAKASDEFCGYWAFAGAFQSYRNAQRRANRYGGKVLDLSLIHI